MKAIFTKPHGPHRIKASDGDGNTAIVDKAMELQHEAQHDAAAVALCTRMGWKGTLAKGYVLKAGATVGRVYVWINGALTPDTIPVG